MGETKKYTYDEAKKIASGKDVNARATLASDETTFPEILFFLANDIESRVRLHVAQNFTAPWEADQLLAKDKESEVRSAVTDKVIEKLDRNNEAIQREKAKNRVWQKVVGIFDGLLEDSMSFIRRKVARTVVAKGYFPKDMVMKLLKHDDQEIAIYAVQHASDLSADELVTLVNGSRSNLLDAIAKRTQLPTEVVDAIVLQGDEGAVSEVLKNPSAKISNESMDQIVKWAKNSEELQADVVQRQDLNLDIIKRISMVVSGSLLKEMMLRNQLTEEDAADLLRHVKGHLEGEEIVNIINDVMNNEFYRPSTEPPQERAYQDFLRGSITEEYLAKAMDCYQDEYVIAGLSLRSNVPQEVVFKAVRYKNAKAIIAIVWRAGFSMRFATDVQKKLAKMMTGVIYPRDGKNYPFTPKEMSWQIDFFMGLGEA